MTEREALQNMKDAWEYKRLAELFYGPRCESYHGDCSTCQAHNLADINIDSAKEWLEEAVQNNN